MRIPLIVVSVILSICAVSANAAEYKRIQTKSEFLSAVADKKTESNWGWIIAASDGSLMGNINGQAAKGSWNWQGEYWCREISFGNTQMPMNCQTVHISGKNLVWIRDKGKGEQTPMKIR